MRTPRARCRRSCDRPTSSSRSRLGPERQPARRPRSSPGRTRTAGAPQCRCGGSRRRFAGALLGVDEPRRHDGDPGLCFSSGRSRASSIARRGREALDHVDLRFVRPEPLRQRATICGRGRADFDADDVAEATLLKLTFHCFEEIGCVVGHLEVGIAGHSERRPLDDGGAGEERWRKCAITCSSVRRGPVCRSPRSAAGPRDLHPREPLFIGLRIRREDGEREREPDMYGNGCPGPTASGVRTG